jgi:urease accessory protein
MLLIKRVIGSRRDPALSEPIHDLEHRGAVDILRISRSEMARRRLRAVTKAGAEVAIALPRQQALFDGAVLFLDAERALVVQMDEQRWLRLEPLSIADAIELGFQAGNLHWRVHFEGAALMVALDAPIEDYLSRLEALLSSRRVVHAIMAGAGAAA